MSYDARILVQWVPKFSDDIEGGIICVVLRENGDDFFIRYVVIEGGEVVVSGRGDA